jgi:CheY-like chemotaxis protein
LKILIAEDEVDIATSYKAALEKRGHQVTITHNGKLCLEEYWSRLDGDKPPFDVVILDYRMPEMNGFEAAKVIRELAPDQRIIFASAYSRETLEDLIKRDGMIAELLQKPFGQQELFDNVEDTHIYLKLQRLKVDVGDLKTWNPTHTQLSDLLGALLRLKDPDAVFEKIFPGSAAGPAEQSREGEIVAAIVDDALRFLGPDSISVFYFHLARIGVQKNAIAKNPDQFAEALSKMFGAASSMVQMRILRALEENGELAQTPLISNFAEALKKVKVSHHKGRKET